MKQEYKKIRLHAFLRTLSPLHISSPESARLDLASMKLVYNDAPGSIPVTLTQKLHVQEQGAPVRSVPVIAANNIMGRIRRHTRSKVLDVIKEKHQKVTMATYMALTCGAATGIPDGRDSYFTEYREAREHPYIGLLGGGPRMMDRYVSCMNSLPYMDATQFMFSLIKHPHLDENVHKSAQDARRLTQFWLLNRNDDLRRLLNIDQAEETIQNFEEEINKRQLSILGAKSKKDEGGSDPRTSTRSFSSFEFVIPGIYFPLRFDLNVNDAQLGLFLLALDSFAATERLGGQTRNGFGLFSLSDVALTDDDNNIVADNIFVNSRLSRESQFVQNALTAWSKAAESLNAPDLDRLFAPPPEKEKDQKAKKVTKEKASKKVEEAV